jgi:Holliday junction resolvasome RuvABC endonuclease subunit
MEYTLLAIDSSLRNTGVAVGTYNKETKEVKISEINLIETSKTTEKSVRASSDTISRNKETYDFVHGLINKHKPKIIFVETPSGSQNSSAMKSYGSTCMLIASLNPTPFEVTPIEVKELSVGSKTASKKEMIDYAHSLYPNLNWDKNKDGSLKNKNEHMADAISIAVAGVKTKFFKQFETFL